MEANSTSHDLVIQKCAEKIDAIGMVLSAPVRAETIAAMLPALGVSLLHPLHRRLLMEIGNGGFGPGGGLFGLSHEEITGHDYTLVALRDALREQYPVLRTLAALPCWQWGAGVFGVIDCRSGVMLLTSHDAVIDTHLGPSDWMNAWADGRDSQVLRTFARYERREIIDPFTRTRRWIDAHVGYDGDKAGT